MALTARQRNNIIFFTSVSFIIILNFVDRFIRDSEKYLPLFDEQHVLYEVDFLGLVWRLRRNIWECNFTYIECTQHGRFWRTLTAMPVDAPEASETYKYAFTLKLQQPKTTTSWYWYPEQALIQSQTNHWYKLPVFAQNKFQYFLEHKKNKP